MTLFPMLPSDNEKSERESNPMPQSVHLYLVRSAWLVCFTDPSKQLPNVKSMLTSLNVDLVCKKYIDLLLF